jgi:hypothetical protein
VGLASNLAANGAITDPKTANACANNALISLLLKTAPFYTLGSIAFFVLQKSFEINAPVLLIFLDRYVASIINLFALRCSQEVVTFSIYI